MGIGYRCCCGGDVLPPAACYFNFAGWKPSTQEFVFKSLLTKAIWQNSIGSRLFYSVLDSSPLGTPAVGTIHTAPGGAYADYAVWDTTGNNAWEYLYTIQNPPQFTTGLNDCYVDTDLFIYHRDNAGVVRKFYETGIIWSRTPNSYYTDLLTYPWPSSEYYAIASGSASLPWLSLDPITERLYGFLTGVTFKVGVQNKGSAVLFEINKTNGNIIWAVALGFALEDAGLTNFTNIGGRDNLMTSYDSNIYLDDEYGGDVLRYTVDGDGNFGSYYLTCDPWPACNEGRFRHKVSYSYFIRYKDEIDSTGCVGGLDYCGNDVPQLQRESWNSGNLIVSVYPLSQGGPWDLFYTTSKVYILVQNGLRTNLVIDLLGTGNLDEIDLVCKAFDVGCIPAAGSLSSEDNDLVLFSH